MLRKIGTIAIFLIVGIMTFYVVTLFIAAFGCNE